MEEVWEKEKGGMEEVKIGKSIMDCWMISCVTTFYDLYDFNDYTRFTLQLLEVIFCF